MRPASFVLALALAALPATESRAQNPTPAPSSTRGPAPAPAVAVPVGPSLELRQALRQIDIDARAIRDGSEPLDAIQREANEVATLVARMPALTVGTNAFGATLVRLREQSAALQQHATSQDTFAAASDAADLLTTLTNLASQVGAR